MERGSKDGGGFQEKCVPLLRPLSELSGAPLEGHLDRAERRKTFIGVCHAAMHYRVRAATGTLMAASGRSAHRLLWS